MYAYPGGSGPAGTWKFTPGRYTPTQDAREIYWDRNAVSPQNKEKGSYVEPEPGKRFRPGDWPSHRPGRPRAVTARLRPLLRRTGVAPGVCRGRAPGRLAAGRRRCCPTARRSASCSPASCSGTANGLLAIGLILIYRTNRIVNFAYGSHRFGGRPVRRPAVPPIAAGTTSRPWAVAVALGLVLGGIVEFLVIRRFARSSRLVLTVATIGLAQVLGGMELLHAQLLRRPGRRRSAGSPHRSTSGVSRSTRSSSPATTCSIVAVVPVVIARPGLVPRPDRRRHRHAGRGREPRPGPPPRHPGGPAVDAGLDRRRRARRR